MANDDRINELYRGEIMSAEAQQRAQARIEWLVSQARGRVLDVGCSQGIVSILCARRGLDVLGIDIQQDRIDYALAAVAEDASDVSDRLDFQVADATALSFGDATFDTVLLGEVIEHLADPAPVLAEIARVVKPDGVIVLTTPFGLSPHPDHEETFYPDMLIRILAPHLDVRSLDVADRYIRVTAAPGTTGDEARAQLVAAVQPSMEATIKASEEKLFETQQRKRKAAERAARLRETLDRQAEARSTRRFQPRNLVRALRRPRNSS